MSYLSGKDFTYGVGDIARRLGQDARPCGAPTSERWRCKHIQGLIAAHGFPDPLPPADPAAISPRARWARASVDNWFDGLDPAAAENIDALAARNAAAIMDARASQGLLVIEGGRA